MAYKIYASGIMKGEYQDDITSPMMEVIILETDGDLTEEEEDEIYDQFDYGRCGCSHDCCGHRHGGVQSISKVWDGRYVVIVSSSRNY